MADATLRMILLGQDRSAGRTLRDVGDEADRTRFRFEGLGDGLGEVGERMSTIMTVAGAAGPAIAAVGSVLSAAAAGGTALVSAMGPAALGGLTALAGGLLAVKGGAAVVKFALDGVADAAGGDAKALAKLSPEGQKLALTLHGLQPELDGVKSRLQSGMFSGFETALTRSSKTYLPLAMAAATQYGNVIGDLADRASKAADAPLFKSSVRSALKGNAQTTEYLGRATIHLADAAVQLFATAQPLINSFFKWAAGASRTIDQTVTAANESGRLGTMWALVADRGTTLWHVVENVGRFLGDVFAIGAADGQGGQLLQVLERATDDLQKWSSSEAGIQAIAHWFDQGRINLAAMWDLITAVSGGLTGLGSGQQLAPLIDQITNEVIPPLMEFLGNASASGALSALVSAVAGVVQVFADLSASDSSLLAFSKTLGALATAAGWIINNVPGASQVLATFFVVAGASAALKLVGLGGAVKALGGALVTLATRFGIAAGAETTETGAITLNTIARQVSTSYLGTWIGVKAIELGAWIRSTAATIASTAATVASAAATRVAAGAARVWAAGQWLLNAALTANPIGLVVVAIGALVAGLIVAYKKSDTFRSIVSGAFRAVGSAVQAMWDVVRPILKTYVNVWMTVVGAIINGAAKAFGWVPGVGGKLKSAASAFNRLKDSVNSSLDGIHENKTITLTVRTRGGGGGGKGSTPANKFAGDQQGKAAGRVAPGLDGASPRAATTAGADLATAFARSAAKSAKSNKVHLTKAGVDMVSGFISGTKSQKTKLHDALKGIHDQVKQAQQQLDDDMKSFADGFTSFTSNVFGADYGTDDAGNAIPPTVDAILAKAAQEKANADALNANVAKLVSMGANADVLQQLQSAGASGVAEINALASGATAAQIGQLNGYTSGALASDRAAGAAAAGVVYGAGSDDVKNLKLAKSIASELGKLDGLGNNVYVMLDGKTVEASIQKTKRKQGKK